MLLTIFIVGLCIGLVIAERVYIHRGGKVPKPRFLQTSHDIVSRKNLESKQQAAAVKQAAGSSSQFDYPVTAPARNDLEEILREIAPTKEVFVAVANKNVNWNGMLNTFCSGIKSAGIQNHLILALDQETKDWCEKNGINAYHLNLEIHKVCRRRLHAWMCLLHAFCLCSLCVCMSVCSHLGIHASTLANLLECRPKRGRVTTTPSQP